MKKKVVLIVITFILLFYVLNKLVTPKYQDELIEGHLIKEYYNEEKNHEVIFIGDCEVYANISPLEMYKNFGITAYVRGTSQQMIWQSYEIIKETIKYEKPKVIVFNVNSMRYSKPVSEAYNRLTLDNMKWSINKINAINSSMTEDETFISYVFPILRYHSRITSLTLEDIKYLFKDKNISFNGFIVNQEIKPYTSLPTPRPLPDYKFDEIDYDYLDKIVELTKENNIKLVLMKAPSLYPYWYQEYEDQIIEYATKNSLDYYNFKLVADEIGIDYNTDTYDGGLHLNLNGATKLSYYFGQILRDKYNLKDYRTDEHVNNVYSEKIMLYNNIIGGKK